jgi:clan AA aspartic protease (TIGR02281 family)
MRRILTLAVGVILGQWLAYGSVQSPAQFDTLAMHAFSRHDYVEAARLWTHAVSLQPDNAIFHYLRGTALARLGQRQSASDAYQLALMLEPSADIARLVRQGLAELRRPATSARARETDVSVEPSRGVWVAMATINGTHEGRFLIDTGSSVTIVSPAAATLLGLSLTPIADSVELQTLAGKTAGQRSVLRSLAIGAVELTDVPVVVHEPGSGLDGILGNTVLGRYQVTLDADRRVLHLSQFHDR